MNKLFLPSWCLKALALLGTATVSTAATLNWTGGALNNNWSDPLNWGGTAPTANDVLLFGGTTNIITNNDIAGYSGNSLFFMPGAGNFALGGNALTLTDTGLGVPTIENDAANSVSSISAPLTIIAGLSPAGAINAFDGDLYFGALTLGANTNLAVTRAANRLTFFGGSINAGTNNVVIDDEGLTVFNAANTFTAPGTLTINGGKLENLNAGGLGTAAAAANSTVVVSAGGQVDFNGITLTGNGKNFRIAGSGPNGRGALVNDYLPMDANKIINSLTLLGNAKIGGTHTIDIGNGAVGQIVDGGGFELTLETRNRFNIRGAISNLPLITVNSGNLELEGVNGPSDTAVVVNGSKSDLGAWLGGAGTIRTWAGNVTLNNGGNIGGIGTGGAANALVIGSAGKTLTINGEGRLNPNTAGFIDWSGISGAGNMRVESTLVGTGKLISGYFGTGTNGTTVVLSDDSPGFTGDVQITGGTLQLGNGGATGSLGTTTPIQFTNGGGTPTLSFNRTGALTFANDLTGPGNIHLDNAAAVLTLTGSNTTGGAGASVFATRNRAGTLILGSANALSSRATFEVGGLAIGVGSLTKFNGNSFRVERFDDAVTDTAGVFNRIVNDSPTPVTFSFYINNAGPVFGDFGGVLGGTTADENNFGITKYGQNDWGLAGNGHSYTGLTTVAGGTFRLANDTAGGAYGIGKLGSSTSAADGTVVTYGGSFDFGGFSAGDERFSISGPGNNYTANGFEQGALRNNPGTAATSTNSVKFVSLAGNSSIGKSGNGVDLNHWEIANAGGVAQLDLNGNTLRKVGNNIVKVSDVTGGTGSGQIVVRQGMLSLERGTVVGAGTRMSVLSRSYLNLNDNGTPIVLNNAPVTLNSGGLINQGGNHTIAGVSTNGYFSAENLSAAETLTLGTISGPARGMGGFIGTTGNVAVSGFAPGQRLGPGFIAGASAYVYPGGGFSTLPTPALVGPAEWDGTKVIAVPLVAMAAGADVGVAASTTVAAGGLDIRTLSSSADVVINNGDLLRVTEGNISQRGANHWIQTNAGTVIGRITSGRDDGEFHLNLPEALDTANRGDITLRVQVVDNPVTTGSKAGSFIPNLFVKNGPGSATNFGGSNFAAAGNNTWNNYTAGAIINGGRVVPQFGSAFGMGPVTVRDGGQIATYNLAVANGAHFSNALELNGVGTLENAGPLGVIRFANATTFSGNTLLASDARVHAHGGADVGTLAGIVRGNSTLEKTGDGFVALTAPNVFDAPVRIARGTLVTNRLANGGAASGIGMSSNAASNLILDGGMLRYDGPGATIDRGFTLGLNSIAVGFATNASNSAIINNYHTGGLTLNPSSIVYAEGGDRSLTLNANYWTTNVFNGVLDDPANARTNLQVGGIGTWQITRNQNLSGNVVVTNSGTNLQGGMLIVGTGGTTGDIGKGYSLTLASASDIAFNRSDTIDIHQTISGAANSEIIQMGTGTLILSGTADNATGNLRVENGGRVVLNKISSLNVHAAAVNMFINNGTVQLSGTGGDQIFNGTNIFMQSTGTLDLNGRNETVGRIEGLGLVTNTAAGTTTELRLGGSGSNFSSAYTGTFIPGVIGATGTGGFLGTIVDGAGTMKVSKDGNGLIGLVGDNTYSGGTEILQGTLQVGRGGNSGSLGTGNIFLGAGDFGTNGSNVGTLRVDRSGTLTMNQVISGPGNVEKRGSGELILTGRNAWEGITVVRNGTLTANLATNDNVLPVHAGYALEGGTVKVLGRATGTSVQNFLPANVALTNVSGTGAGAGAATFNVQGGNLRGDNNGGNLIINLPPTLNRPTGGSIDFSTAGAGTTTFRHSGANVNGILAGTNQAYATWNGTTWAIQTGSGTIGGLPLAGYSPTVHADLPSGVVPIPGGTSVSTARLNSPGATTVDLSAGTTTLTQGGILVTPNVGASSVVVQNGTIAPTGNELFVHQHNTLGDLEISAVIGGTNSTITKAGAGRLILSGTNGGSGAVHINQGTLQIGNGTAGTIPTGAIFNDSVLVVNRNNIPFAGPALFAAGNAISGNGSVLVNGGTGWIDFNKAASTYTGITTISSGYVEDLINNSGQVSPVYLGDANTGSQPIALVSNHTAVTNYNYPIVVTNQGTGPVIIGSSGGTGAVGAIYNGTVELNRPTILTGYHPDRTTFTNSITGNVGTLTIDVFDGSGNPLLPGATPVASTVGARRVTWDGTNSFVGNVEIRNGSTLQIGAGTAGVFRDHIPDASNVSLFGTNSTLQFNYDGEVINNLNGEVGTVVRSIATGGPWMVLAVNGGTFDGEINASVNNTTAGNGMYLEKNGNGTLTLGGTANNTQARVRMNSGTLILNKTGVYAIENDLTLHGGTVQLSGSGDNQIADGTVVTVNGGILDLNGKNETVSVLQGLGGTITNTAAATTSTLSIGNATNASSSTFYGTIADGAGAVKLTKTSAVAHGLTLASDNTYSGGTTVDAGVLQIGNGGTAGTAGTGPITAALNTRVVVDRSNAFTLVNDIGGAGNFVQQGGNLLTLTGNNTYSGVTTINDGSLLRIGAGGSAGTVGTGNISNFGELQFNRIDTMTLAQSIADLPGDVGIVRQMGAGKTILTGVSSYSGQTIINAGTLQIDNKVWSGAVQVDAGGTLGGIGQLTAPTVTVNGIVSPGASPGTLDVDATIAFSGASSAFNVELGGNLPGDGSGFYDQLNMINAAGSVSLDAGSATTLNVGLDGGFIPAVGDNFYILNRADGAAFSSIFSGLPEGATFPLGGNLAQITYLANWTGTQAGSSPTGGNDVALTIVLIPEPGTAALAFGAICFLGLGRRRKSVAR